MTLEVSGISRLNLSCLRVVDRALTIRVFSAGRYMLVIPCDMRRINASDPTCRSSTLFRMVTRILGSGFARRALVISMSAKW
jgi:hypothetical protein